MKIGRIVSMMVAFLVVAGVAWATGSLSIPNTFQTQSGNVPVSQLDSNFTTIRDYVNNREVTLGLAAARPAAGTAGRWWVSTDVAGGTLFVDNGAAWVQVAQGVSVASFPTLALTNNTNWLTVGTGQIGTFTMAALSSGRTWTWPDFTGSVPVFSGAVTNGATLCGNGGNWSTCNVTSSGATIAVTLGAGTINLDTVGGGATGNVTTGLHYGLPAQLPWR